MVSNGQMTGLILAIVVPLTAIIAILVFMKRKAGVKWLVIPFFFGVIAFVWQAVIKGYLIAYAAVPLSQVEFFNDGFGLILGQMFSSALDACFVVLALIWALYFSNLRDFELKRAPFVGLGFGLGFTVMNYVIRFLPLLIRAFKIRNGSFDGTEEELQIVQSLRVENTYLFILSCLLYTLMITGVALLMGFFHSHHVRGRMFLSGFVISFVVGFFNTLFPELMPDMVSVVVYNLFLAALACVAMWTVVQYLRGGQYMIWKNKPGERLLPSATDKKTGAGSGKKKGQNASKTDFSYAGNKKKK